MRAGVALYYPFLKAIPNFIKIGPKLAELGFGVVLARVVGWVGGWLTTPTTSNSRSKLCSPFLTYTPSFIQIGPKSAKLVLWGGLGGGGRE